MIRTIIICLFIFSKSLLFSQNRNDSLLYWTEGRQLSWIDFKGVPDSCNYFAAVTSAKIHSYGFWEDDLPQIKVICYFNKIKSWTRDTLSSRVLNHEQLHFDICELYTRRIRKELSKLRMSKEKKLEAYYDIMNELLHENKIKQKEYDSKTQHGVILDEQEKWNKKVKAELEALEEYKVDYTKYLKRE